MASGEERAAIALPVAQLCVLLLITYCDKVQGCDEVLCTSTGSLVVVVVAGHPPLAPANYQY
jgi:hypothetical protein